MQPPIEDEAMDRKSRGDEGRRGVVASQILAAAIIWSLILYALSPLNRPPATRLASRAPPLCAPP